jgi:hypothetical protein
VIFMGTAASRAACTTTLLVCLLTGCARGPSLSQATGQLESDSRSVLTEGAAQLGAGRPKILSDEVQSCPGGKARHVQRAELSLRPGAVPLDEATDVSIALVRERGYRLESPPWERTFSMARQAPEVRFVVHLSGRRHDPYVEFDSETPCLPRD